ncbi:MAG: hypothetical protein RLO52_19425 [Sandaracinaceae bacterium]
MNRILNARGAPLLAALLLAACGGAPGTHPDDMSATDHRAAADSHDEESERHGEQYDPDALELRDRTAASGDVYDFVQDVYNPTSVHLAAAGEHADVAEQHRRAAEALEAFEAEQCGSFPPDTRALCPLLGQLAGAENTDGGVRLQFRADVNAEAVHAHVECHVAFARTHGRDGMDHCPMYVPGVRVERDEAGATLLLTDDEASIPLVRRRAQAHVTATE